MPRGRPKGLHALRRRVSKLLLPHRAENPLGSPQAPPLTLHRHQYVSQLDEDIRDGILGNVGTVVSFRVGAQDAPIIAKAIGAPENELRDLPRGQAWVRVQQDSEPHRALPVKTALVELSTGNLEAAKRNTRASYSRTDRPKPSTRSWKPWKGGDGWHRPPRAQHRRHRAAPQGTKCNGPCCLCSRTIGSPVPTGYVHIDLSPGTPFPVPGRFFVWDGGSRRREAGGNPFGGID